MKIRLISVLLIAVLILTVLAGCGAKNAIQKIEAAENAVEDKIDAIENSLEAQVPGAAAAQQADTENLLTQADAEAIALKHAGFTADQVTGLRTEFEIEHGVPEYEIDFRVDRVEYDYTIHAEDGSILSFEKDND